MRYRILLLPAALLIHFTRAISSKCNETTRKLVCFEQLKKISNIEKLILRADCSFNNDENYTTKNTKCEDYKLLLVMKNSSAKEYMFLAVVPRGNRIQVINIEKNKTFDPDQKIFHHYSSYVPTGSVINDVFTVNYHLFISTIHKHAYIKIYHVNISFQNATMILKISDEDGYRLSPNLVPPLPHSMTHLHSDFLGKEKYKDGFLQAIYTQSYNLPIHANIPLDVALRDFGRAVYIKHLQSLPPSWSGYLKVNEDFHCCLEKFNSILAYKSDKRAKFYNKPLIANIHPVRTYPITGEYEELYQLTVNWTGILVVSTQVSVVAATIWLLTVFHRWRGNQLQQESINLKGKQSDSN